MMISFLSKKSNLLVILFFLAFLILGLFIYKDYGVPWDEPAQIAIGENNFQYVTGINENLLTFSDRYYGPIFELLLTAAAKIINKYNYPDFIYLRHLSVFLLFYIGVVFFYLLINLRFKNWKYGLLGSIFLILSPRIFADSFYNSKDLVFLSVFIISIYTMIRFLERKKLLLAIIHAVTCAILIDIRLLGIIVPCLTAFLFFIDFLSVPAPAGEKFRRFVPPFVYFSITIVPLIILMFPVSWNDPLHSIYHALKLMGRYTTWKQQVLYMGQYVEARELPWHYIPVWILITTPLFYSFNFFIGLVKEIFSLVRGITHHIDQAWKDSLIYMVWFFVPLAGVIIGRSILYDGWRHMFFIYPAFIMITLSGWIGVWEYAKKHSFSRIISPLWIILTIISCSVIAIFMIRNHPNQNVYFNALAGRSMQEVRYKFDMDYWGLSYRQALEYVLSQDPSPKIPVYVENWPGQYNRLILPSNEADRLEYVQDPALARYYISNYRYHREDYNFQNQIFAVKVGNTNIMVVYRLGP